MEKSKVLKKLKKNMKFVSTDKQYRFTLLKKLGSGGFGAVWTIKEFPNYVIKIEPIESEGLIDEIKIYQSLFEQTTEPVLVPKFLTFGFDNRYRFMVIEKFDNDITNIIIRMRVRLILAVQESLDEVHKFGFVHRDIKSANIFSRIVKNNDGFFHRIVLGDYGLAKSLTLNEKEKHIFRLVKKFKKLIIKSSILRKIRTSMPGTAVFMSVDIYFKRPATKRSDYQNFLFWIVYICLETLPWEDEWFKNENFEAITLLKVELLENPKKTLKPFFAKWESNTPIPYFLVDLVEAVEQMEYDCSNFEFQRKKFESILVENIEPW